MIGFSDAEKINVGGTRDLVNGEGAKKIWSVVRYESRDDRAGGLVLEMLGVTRQTFERNPFESRIFYTCFGDIRIGAVFDG